MNTDIIKQTGSHYTSNELSIFMAKLLKKHYTKDNTYTNNSDMLNLLDPSCGEGHLLKAVEKEFSEIPHKLIGVDINEEAAEVARNNLNKENTTITTCDYLEQIPEKEIDLFNSYENNHKVIPDKVDLIIANPPYVRTQLLNKSTSETLVKNYGLKGKVDLYQIFIAAMTNNLKENGIICVITSNRYLTTESGKTTRKMLSENYEILEVLDLGDTKLFEAAVLPAIFIGKKKSQPNKNINAIPFTKIYETTDKHDEIKESASIFNLLQSESGKYFVGAKKYELLKGYLKIPEDPSDLWIMASPENIEWAKTLRSNSNKKFSDIFKVRVGIKTTADKVFIRNNWSDLPSNITPEPEVLHNLISSRNIGKWSLDHGYTSKILYTHEVVEGKRKVIDFEKYPRAKKYLDENKEILSSRKYVIKANRKWYEIWVPQDPEAMKRKKVVFPDISQSPKFMVDEDGSMVDGNCYWLTLKDGNSEDYLYLAAAVANSRIMSKYHSIEFQNVLYSGRKRYITQYVNKYLLPDIETEEAKEVISLAKQLITENDTETEVIEEKIEQLLNICFKIN
ncbi:DNA modification methyltransferase [Alkalibacterium sp. AK22]|uniref:Eco57I restriction-modification methylase domain-containing protein n=1 Tax=Alkalibacterium sp. AK22 TaxID=1229520 RepID=UPI00044DAA2A|nr:N-6 DNA methylase [Alkalibacterium sp. AK22]EXJ24411.1 DNA modification methyltransferase [Alkalibacterium sp. AK22]